MSGLAGAIHPHLFQASQLLAPMLQPLRHRGLIGEDQYSFRHLQLGVCGGKVQTNQQRTLHLIIDGNLYNQKELANLLSSKEKNTSQLILEAYEKWGEDSFSKLNGDFAFALFDKQKENLFLVKDRIGTKPLYWYEDGGHFLFASELKGLLATGMIPQSPSLEGIAAYLSLGYIPQDLSPIDKVNKLLPGYYLQYNLNKGKAIHPYWSYSSFFTKEKKAASPLTSEEFKSKLLHSVELRIPQNERVGCLLLGGIGSSSIAHYVNEATSTSPCAFTTTFEEQNHTDYEAATMASQSLHIEHHNTTITKETMLNHLVEMLWFMDEPHADPNALAIWGLAKLAKKETNTVFSGMGCDELLAAHDRYQLHDSPSSLSLDWRSFSHSLLPYLFPLLQKINSRLAYRLLRSSHSNPWQGNYLRSNALFSSKTLSKAAPELSRFFNPNVFLNKFHHLDRLQSITSSFQYFDVKTRLPDFYNLQFDRIMNAHQLDWRAPFLDPSIVEYLASHWIENTSSLAPFLTDPLQNIFPKKLLSRQKTTRKNFLSNWIVTANLLPLFRQLPYGSLVETGIISKKWIKEQLSSSKKMESSFSQLWALFTLEIWYRLYIHHPHSNEKPTQTPYELIFEDV